MNYRPGAPNDAEDFAGLIASFQSELTDDPSGAGAEQYLASVTAAAETQYLQSDRYSYVVAIDGPELVGFIAIRDGSHLFHLFVARSHQRRGLARHLWQLASASTGSAPAPRRFTVNSSLNAIAVYKAFGFVATGAIKHVHGISFLPMQLGEPCA